jgi:hypothetical protein
VQRLDNFPAFYRTWSLITTFIRALHLSLLRARPMQSTPPLLLYSCHMPHPFHRLQLDYSNYIWWKVQIMKLLVMQFSPPSHHLIPPRYPVLKHPEYVPPLMSDRVSHPYRTTGKITDLCTLILKFFDSRWKHRRFWTKSNFDLLLSFTNIWTMTHFQIIPLIFLCPNFLHSGDETATYN